MARWVAPSTNGIGEYVDIWMAQPDDDIQAMLANPRVGQLRIPAGLWEVQPLVVTRSNLIISFESGSIFRAAPGAYGQAADALIKIAPAGGGTGARPTNIRIVGDAPDLCTLGFYDDEEYTGEFRHVIWATNCDGVIIEGVGIDVAYGDGIFLGDENSDSFPNAARRSTNIRIADVTVQRASRNGIAVNAVDGLTVQRVAISNIRPLAPGVAPTGPWAGFDVEPDQDQHPLSGILIEDVTISDTAGVGFLIELANAACAQDGNTCDIEMNRITVSDSGGAGFRLSNAFYYLHGSLTVTELDVRRAGDAGIEFRDKSRDGLLDVSVQATLTDCNQNPLDVDEPATRAPLAIYMQTAVDDFAPWNRDNGRAAFTIDVNGNTRPDLAWLAGRDSSREVQLISGTIHGVGDTHGDIHQENTEGITLAGV